MNDVLVLMPGVHYQMCSSSASGCTLTEQEFIEYKTAVSLFQVQDVWKQEQKQWGCSWYYCTSQVSTVRLKVLSLFSVFVFYVLLV